MYRYLYARTVDYSTSMIVAILCGNEHVQILIWMDVM